MDELKKAREQWEILEIFGREMIYTDILRNRLKEYFSPTQTNLIVATILLNPNDAIKCEINYHGNLNIHYNVMIKTIFITLPDLKKVNKDYFTLDISSLYKKALELTKDMIKQSKRGK